MALEKPKGMLGKRIETMRNVSKGPPIVPDIPVVSIAHGEVFCLIDSESGTTIGLYTTEALADEAAIKLWQTYQFDSYVDVLILDDDNFGQGRGPKFG